MEVAAQAVKNALHALVAVVVDIGDHVEEEARGWWHIDLGVERDHAIHQGPGRLAVPSSDFITKSHQRGVSGVGVVQPVDEVEAWGERVSLYGIDVTVGQGVNDDVGAAGHVFHCEVKAQQFANPMVLWDSHQSLIKQKFEAVMIRADHKVAPQEVWTPVVHGLDQSDQLSLIGCKDLVTRGR